MELRRINHEFFIYSRAMQGPDKTEQCTGRSPSLFDLMSQPQQAIRTGSAASSGAIDQAQPVLSSDEVRAMFRARGINVAEWARARGFSVELTRMVLAGKRKCLRGQSHQIAVEMGMKSAR